MTALAALPQARQALRASQFAQALALVRRVPEPIPAELRGIAVRALWSLARLPEAEVEVGKLALAVHAGNSQAIETQADLVRWHLQAQRPEPAWQALAPLVVGGCRTASTCRLAATTTLAIAAHLASASIQGSPVPAAKAGVAPVKPAPSKAVPPVHTVPFANRALQVAPPPGTARRAPWLQEVAADLAAADRLTDARALLEAARTQTPDDAQLWIATYVLARRAPEQDMRVRWLADLRAAQLPAAVLTTIATSPDPPREAPVAAAILELAAHRPDATETQWLLWATALGKADDKATLRGLAEGPQLAKFASELARKVLAKNLLVVGLADLALALVQRLPASDGATMVLEAEILRQRGMLPEARLKAAAAAATGADHSEAVVLLTELWRTPMGLDLPNWLANVAESPGICQRTAARMRALRLVQANRPAANASLVVQQYARLLTADPAPPPCMLAEGFEPPVAWSREQLVRQLDTREPWRETAGQVMRLFADAGVADAAMWRTLAIRRLHEGSVDAFLRLDLRARTEAEKRGEPLGNDRLLMELASRSAAALARWLRESGVREADEPQTAARVATSLLAGSFAGLGRRWAEQAVAARAPGDPMAAMSLVAVLNMGGAADLALELLRGKPPTDGPQDIAQAQGEIDALLRLDRADEARKRLDRLLARADLVPRQLRLVADFAHDRGLCESVVTLGPRLVADPDIFVLRTGLKTALDCARRLDREDAAADLVKAVQAGGLDPARLDILARELGLNGFDALAVAVYDRIEKIRPMSDDSLHARARSLLALGRSAEAGQMLQRMAQITGRGRRASPYASGADLLENHGHFAIAATFWQRALEADPDSASLRVRLIGNALRQGATEDLPLHLQALFKSGPSVDDLRALQAYAERCGAVRPLHDALAGVVDPDRDLERFRLDLAAKLGLRDVVEAGVRRLKAHGSTPPGRAPEWLLQVGAWREARDVASDVLTAPEPTGDPRERILALELALDRQRDPSSAAESLSLARLYVGRALDTGSAAMQAASVLASRGLSREALAVLTLAGPPEAAGRLCVQGQIEADAGQPKVARQSWRRATATLLLDPKLRDWLKNALRMSREYDNDVGRDFRCIHEALREAGEQATLTDWLRELVQIAPDAPLLRASLVQALLEQGLLTEAVLALQEAARTLPEMRRDDFQSLADRVVREGGAPELMRWFVNDGEALRTEPWFVAFVDAVLAGATQTPAPVDLDFNNKLEKLHAWLAALPIGLPEVRMGLALQWASRGHGERSVQALGLNPLIFHQDRPERLRDAVQVVAAALIALSGTPGGIAAARAQADRWIRTGFGTDVTSPLAAELVRQGMPQLASHVQGATLPSGRSETSTDRQRTRLHVALAAGTEDEVAAEALASVKGRRANLQYIDELYVYLLGSGRVPAARRVAAMLMAEEPGLRPPALLDPGVAGKPAMGKENAAPETAAPALEQYRPEAAAWLRQAQPGVSLDLAETAQRVAVALSPTLAEQWTAGMAGRSDEAWHAWMSLLQAAIDFEQLDLARTALQRAVAAHAPAGLLACPQLWLDRTGTLATCLRSRPLDAVPVSELADVAASLALATDEAGERALFETLMTAPPLSRRRFIEAAASRLWVLDAAQKLRLAKVMRAVHDALPPARRDAFVLASLDELAALGLGELGVAVTERAFRMDPDGRGQRNNLAYARFLAGQDTREIQQLARPAAFDSGGESAYASLDTLGALAWAAGDKTEAIALQRRALASALVRTDDLLRRALGPGADFARTYRVLASPVAGLPLVRLAEFLLSNGALDEARLLAAQVLAGGEDAPTAQRARRVVRAALEAGRKQP